MGIASLVLGIISIIIGWIPFVCFIVFVVAVTGLVLGIIDTIQKTKKGNDKRAISIAGLIVCAVAIPIIIINCIVSLVIFIAIGAEDSYYNDYDWYDDYYDYHYDHDWNPYYNSIKYYNIEQELI